MSITCTSKTEHYATGKKLLQHYDENHDGVIERAESIDAIQDYFNDKITKAESEFVVLCYDTGSIDETCEAAAPKKCSQSVQVKDDKGNVLRQAKVIVDGTTKYTDIWGRPCSFTLTIDDEYEAVASKSGYECHECKKSFTACTGTITLTLKKPVPKTADITFDSTPKGVAVRVDGTLIGNT